MNSTLFLLFDVMGGANPMSFIISLFSVLVMLFVIFPLNRVAKGYVAYALGDDTAEREGRLTLNPFVHIDPMGAAAMLICSIGWSKPMPININKCRKVSTKTAVVLISLAGPLSLFLLGFVMMILCKVVLNMGDGDIYVYIGRALYMTAQLSVFLSVWNLLPIPPFDGFQILSVFLPPKALHWVAKNMQIINIVFIFLIFSRALSVPLSYLNNALMSFLDHITSWV